MGGDMKYKLIALDVDGTLLNDNHELTEQTKQTIQEVSRTGAEIVLCTGRGPQNSIPFMEEIGLKGYVISHNGAATVDVVTKEVVHQFSMDTKAIQPYMDYFRDKRFILTSIRHFACMWTTWTGWLSRSAACTRIS